MSGDALDLRGFLGRAPLVPFIMDPGSEDVVWVGPQAEALFGHPLEEWMQSGFWERVIVPDDRQLVRDTRRAAGVADGRVMLDYQARARDGSSRWIAEVSHAAMVGGLPRLEGYLVNVTARKNRELTLWRSEERMRSLLRNAPDAMVLTDLTGRVLDMNAQAERLFQYELAEVTGSSIDPIVPERLRGRIAELRKAFERDPERRSLVDGQTLAVVQRDGTEIPVEIGMSLVSGSDGSRHLLNTFRDLTARRRAEQQLRSSERRLRQIANVVPAMVSFVDADMRFRFVNDVYSDWLGWRRHQVEGRRVREVLGEGLYRDISGALEQALQGRAGHISGDMTGPDGRLLPVDISLVPQFDEHGEVDGCSLVIFDISDEVAARNADRRHREELAHVARVATLGELAASIAHELNQPLSAVAANAHAARRLLAHDPPDLDEVMEALDDVAADARRAGEVIASMRQLLQDGESEERELDLAVVARDVVELLHSESVARGVAVGVDASEGVDSRVRGDAPQLTQLLLNLVKNGVEAASARPAPPRVVTVSLSEAPGAVVVEVADNGPGFGSDDPETLFQPFVTRRRDGLGMGLSISRTIAESHQGSLVGRPREGGGASFVLRLPAADRGESAPA